MKKIINSADRDYQPVETQNLVLDDVPTVNSFNGVTSDAVARAIAGASGEVPVVTESDNGKVLKAVYDAGGPAVEWGEATVDQTYDATSTNAQSGTAVAQAIAEIPTVSYTAGDGIDISANEVSVKAGTGLEIADLTSNIALKCTAEPHGNIFNPSYLLPHMGVLTAEAVAYFKNNSAAIVTTNYSYTSESKPGQDSVYGFAICRLNSDGEPTAIAFVAYRTETTDRTIDANTVLTLDFTHWAPQNQSVTWADIEANPANYCLSFGYYYVNAAGFVNFTPCIYDVGGPSAATLPQVAGEGTYDASVYTQGDTDMLVVSNPLPAYAAGDAGKVLQVNAGGNGTQWTNYVPAEVVQALPANPTSGVLYIVTGA